LIFLSLVTLGIYSAHYIKRQTLTLNVYLDKERQISEGFVNSILILAYVTVILLVPYFLVEEGHPIETKSDSLDTIWAVLVVIWAFKARNRMNTLLAAPKGQADWFHGLWTFLFTVFYFNFKINTMNENALQPTGFRACLTCGYQNASEARFCNDCGATMSRTQPAR
jgi:hypothetical protein